MGDHWGRGGYDTSLPSLKVHGRVCPECRSCPPSVQDRWSSLRPYPTPRRLATSRSRQAVGGWGPSRRRPPTTTGLDEGPTDNTRPPQVRHEMTLPSKRQSVDFRGETSLLSWHHVGEAPVTLPPVPSVRGTLPPTSDPGTRRTTGTNSRNKSGVYRTPTSHTGQLVTVGKKRSRGALGRRQVPPSHPPVLGR